MAWYDPTTWFEADEEDVSTDWSAPDAEGNFYGDTAFQEHDTPTSVTTTPNSAQAHWTQDPGTTYAKERTDAPGVKDHNAEGTGADDFMNRIGGNGDARNVMYGRRPGAADDAANLALRTGSEAQTQGATLQDSNRGIGLGMLGRAAPQANWGLQGDALRGATGYGTDLAGLEATQGPSAAQAQLQAGTNQALDSQIALARSGRGFGGNAAAAGLAQQNLAGIQANNANSAAMLRAQEDAAWRGRQAQNLGQAAGIQTAVGSQYGQQAQTDLGAALTTQGQNDAAALGWAGQGLDAWKTGIGFNLAGQNQATGVRGMEMQGGQAAEDLALRQWAAKNGYDLAQGQRDDQKSAAAMNAGATIGAAAIAASDIRGKTRIAPSNQAGQDFARGNYFDGTIYRPTDDAARGAFLGTGTRLSAADGFRAGATAAKGLTPMQAEFMGGGNKPDGGGESGAPAAAESTFAPEARPDTSKPFDLDSMDASSLDAVRNSPASFYDYKDPSKPGADDQRHYGPMAQDLAKTPAGRSAVVKQPDGSLGVDTGRLALVTTGAVNEQQKQLDAITAELEALRNKPISVQPSQVYGGR